MAQISMEIMHLSGSVPGGNQQRENQYDEWQALSMGVLAQFAIPMFLGDASAQMVEEA